MLDALERAPRQTIRVGDHSRWRDGVMSIAQFETRRAQRSDADDIAVAHRDSIRSIGPWFYPTNVVEDWQAGLTGDVYVKAMEGGEVFFVATGEIDGKAAILGFATDYCIDGSQRGT